MKIAFLSICNPNETDHRSGELHHNYETLKKQHEVIWIKENITALEGYDLIVYADFTLIAHLETNIPLVYMEKAIKEIEKLEKENNEENREEFYIPVYAINLKEREERRRHILKEFEGKEEFELTVMEACTHPIGAVGLWNSMVQIIRLAKENDDDLVVICEDDHFFTKHYSRERLFQHIFGAHSQGVDVLAGGIGGFGLAIPAASDRYWIDWFWCTQFIVVYKKFYQRMLDYSFKDSDTADGVISMLSSNKMVIYPFISEQKDFGYSDVTQNNMDNKGLIEKLFIQSGMKIKMIQTITEKFRQS